MTRQITFRRTRTTRALATAVLPSALVLIGVITLYLGRPGHAANHKHRQEEVAKVTGNEIYTEASLNEITCY